MPRQIREQIMIDQPVQGALLRRVTVYWCFCLGTVVLSSGIWAAYSEPDWDLGRWSGTFLWSLVPGLVGSFLFLPLVWADILRLSNRFVGPIQSLRTALRRMLYNDDVPKLSTRKDDFWQDAIEQFNQVTERRA